MNRKHIITVAGKPGSGKSTTANRVAELLDFKRFSSGDLMREIAKKRGISLLDLLYQAETDESIDHEVDRRIKDFNSKENYVIDSRLAFHWIPESFKVYLDLDLSVSAVRIFKDMSDSRVSSGEAVNTVHEVKRDLEARLLSERKRYNQLYGIDPHNISHFDLIINTERNKPSIVALTIFDMYKKWLTKESWSSVHYELPVRYRIED